jgi:hypothetical protein
LSGKRGSIAVRNWMSAGGAKISDLAVLRADGSIGVYTLA